MRYQNFDIWIDKGNGGGYPLRAVSEYFGEGRGILRLEPRSEETQEDLDRLARRDTDRDFLSRVGSELYDHLFQGEIGALFQQCHGGLLGKENEGVRLRLRIEAPEIAILPWELLHSPTMGCFLGTLVRFPLVRYLELLQPIRAFETQPPLRILVAIPESRAPYPVLDAETERANLIRALEILGDSVRYTILDGNATRTRISDSLMDAPYHCFHFIGHGVFQGDRGFILLNSENGGMDHVDQEQFAGLFRNHETMKLVVLNSCKGAEISSSRPLVGVAPQLVKLGIPAVVAMQYAIYDEVAVLFAREFYRSLFKGRNRGRIEVAISHARNRLASDFPDERAMATPVLFMRAREGLLFHLVTGSRVKDIPISTEAMHTTQAALETHKSNIDILEEHQKASFDPLVGDELHKEVEELHRLKQRLRFRNYSMATAVFVVFFVFFLAWISFFDFLTLDTKIESYTIWLGDLFTEKTFSDQILLVVVDNETERFLGKAFDKSWRREHGLLVEKLSEAGAKVIAFDMFFEEPGPLDEGFINSVRRARELGTAVIVGFRDLEGREPKLVEGLRGAVSGFGSLCVGRKLGYARTASLAIRKKNNHHIPSLTLKALAAYQGRDNFAIDRASRQISIWKSGAEPTKIGFSNLEIAKQNQPYCPAIRRGDSSADIFIDLSPAQVLRDPSRRCAYERVLDPSGSVEPKEFTGKIVLVGVEKGDRFPVYRGLEREYRSGVELHADALNTVLNGVNIHSLRQVGQLFIMICLGLVGAFIRCWTPRAHGSLRIVLVFVVLITYLAGTVYLYSQYRILMNTVYHVGALLLAYWLVGKIERRWFS
jgi:CHASE2 domain-containing sensor protein